MNDFLIYILKSTLCLSLLYLAFRTVMRKEAFFALNRMVLIAVVVFSFIIPFLYLPSSVKPIIQESILPQVSFYESETELTTAVEIDKTTVSASSPVTIQKEKTFHYSARQIILIIYLSGVIFSFLGFLYGIISILLMLRKAQAVKKEGYLLFVLENDIPAFSFWKMIFISRVDYTDHGTTILAHEQQHIRLGHFYDLLLMEMAKMAHWFNPVIYWLIQDLKAIHEYQADQHTLSKGIDARKYQLLIIEKGVGPQRFSLANSFNHCQIKKRITMMNQSKNGKAGLWKVATFLPLLALLLMAFGRTGENEPLIIQPQKAISNEKNVQAKDTTGKAEEKVHLIVEEMPEFPGGEKALRQWISENIKYPEAAKAKRIQGKVFVSFIVDAQGKVTNPKILRGVDPDLNAEALRVISALPQWSPGKQKGKPMRVSYTTPVYFVLPPGTSAKNVQTNNPSEKEKLIQEKSNKKESAPQSNDSVYSKVEVIPQFPGGESGLRKYIADNVKYPLSAVKANVQGKVFVNFIITSVGKVINPKVVKSVSPELDVEAIRVISMMPQWTPAKEKGKPVRMSYTIPVNFVLK